MAENTGNDHKHRAAACQYRQYESAHYGFILFFTHPLDKYRQIHKINRNNRQFRRIEYKRACPHTRQIGTIEIQEPACNHCQCCYRRISRHFGSFVYLTEYFRIGAFFAGCQRIHTACTSQHKSVCRTQARDRHKQIEDITQYSAKNICECHRCALFDQLLIACTACHTDVVT